MPRQNQSCDFHYKASSDVDLFQGQGIGLLISVIWNVTDNVTHGICAGRYKGECNMYNILNLIAIQAAKYKGVYCNFSMLQNHVTMLHSLPT